MAGQPVEVAAGTALETRHSFAELSFQEEVVVRPRNSTSQTAGCCPFIAKGYTHMLSFLLKLFHYKI